MIFTKRFIFFISLFCITAQSTTFYASFNGSDDSDCTSKQSRCVSWSYIAEQFDDTEIKLIIAKNTVLRLDEPFIQTNGSYTFIGESSQTSQITFLPSNDEILSIGESTHRTTFGYNSSLNGNINYIFSNLRLMTNYSLSIVNNGNNQSMIYFTNLRI